ncbi:DNA topoisomerase IB [Virgisporangium ochraceum]|uniref:DNA topoisomerase n=1 Tax=Virgisporangium ochraceum TaxID=65505 RepID=A0A8J4A1H8_9ACTN|nr:DNA topoisomerase IB [Virgisporangium ochraceum]GIJ73486.1 DNA topoisomerase [Virgisporangium ochraceum]
MRTRRSDPTAPGYRRIRQGKGFRYLDQHGKPLPTEEVERVKALVIPPAWKDVWICPDPKGHIQAVGTDAAGRRQYRYHDGWRERQDRLKFDHVLDVARKLPRLRKQLKEHLKEEGLTRDRVLAVAVSLLDHARLRVGGDEYATGDEATYGAATLQARHVRVDDTQAAMCFTGKGGIQHEVTVDDPDVVAAIAELRAARKGAKRLLFWRDGNGDDHDVHAADINDFLRDNLGVDATAKDFRTIHATVLAAAELSRGEPAKTRTAQKKRIAAVMKEVASELGNTPAVAKASYVDPRVIDRYAAGDTIDRPDAAPASVERQVVKLLDPKQ